ncbi:hypothetical protein CC80DRAFT_421970, partial [Byssothecium circinans]
GYLLYRLPRTRKSSLCLFIIGYFNLDVYVFTISSLNDYSLKSLFTKLPQHCIVLLEDIDVISASQNSPANTKVSLSTLLNVLDSLVSSISRLLIITTNYINRLDLALIRPSYVDIKLELYLANKDIIN